MHIKHIAQEAKCGPTDALEKLLIAVPKSVYETAFPVIACPERIVPFSIWDKVWKEGDGPLGRKLPYSLEWEELFKETPFEDMRYKNKAKWRAVKLCVADIMEEQEREDAEKDMEMEEGGEQGGGGVQAAV
jgi:hypothetical protein